MGRHWDRNRVRWWLYNSRDRVKSEIERWWRCDVHNQHHVKMDSYPHCYRCGRWVGGASSDRPPDSSHKIEMWHYGWWKH